MNNTQNVTIVGHPESGELFTASKKEGFYKQQLFQLITE